MLFMAAATDNLPNDIEALKALVRQQQIQIVTLQEKLNLALAKRFGPSSEKSDKQQLGLFNEAEAAVDTGQDEEPVEQTLSVPAHQRKKPGRRPLPDYIEREEVLHDLPQAEKVCPHDGTPLKRIGEEVSEQLDVIPARVRVLRHIRPKWKMGSGLSCCISHEC